ncbi:hypothetical protein PSTG_14760 [Puccinia striiformis f. sp. tritici PST-78]|uniref:Uncharacterized protein n=1 Tax=Puccinia striiformis f. sp. tritici PST-78 TaxID=1165861 RepID=A0A0L0UY43_9BASI|nr:hypothetical protein PSTG_14760 [Puccinia striiformis f. sp. tritici PST-78]
MRYNALSRNLETALKTARIPVRMLGAQKFFDRVEKHPCLPPIDRQSDLLPILDDRSNLQIGGPLLDDNSKDVEFGSSPQ